MTRVLGVLAGLLRIAGMVVLALAIQAVSDAGEYRSGDLIVQMDPPTSWLSVGTALVGVAGLPTAGTVFARRAGQGRLSR